VRIVWMECRRLKRGVVCLGAGSLPYAFYVSTVLGFVGMVIVPV
jgi:hypothetical protein